MSAGPYSIGSTTWPGLSKLIEEMGEVAQVAGKLMGTGGQLDHWDGTNLRERLEDELADLTAAMAFFATVAFSLDREMRLKFDSGETHLVNPGTTVTITVMPQDPLVPACLWVPDPKVAENFAIVYLRVGIEDLLNITQDTPVTALAFCCDEARLERNLPHFVIHPGHTVSVEAKCLYQPMRFRCDVLDEAELARVAAVAP